MKENVIIILIIILILIVVGILVYVKYTGLDTIHKILNLPNELNNEIVELNATVNNCVAQLKDVQIKTIQQNKKISFLNKQPIIKIGDDSEFVCSDNDEADYYMSENTKEKSKASNIPLYTSYLDTNEYSRSDFQDLAEDNNNQHIFNDLAESNNNQNIFEHLIEKNDLNIFNDLAEINNPDINDVIEPIIEPIIEPVIEPIIEPVIEPIIEPLISIKMDKVKNIDNDNTSLLTVKTEVLEQENDEPVIKIEEELVNLKPINKYDNNDIKRFAKYLSIPQSYKLNGVRKLYKKEELYKKIKLHIKNKKN